MYALSLEELIEWGMANQIWNRKVTAGSRKANLEGTFYRTVK